jgi:hypothetical protein
MAKCGGHAALSRGISGLQISLHKRMPAVVLGDAILVHVPER